MEWHSAEKHLEVKTLPVVKLWDPKGCKRDENTALEALVLLSIGLIFLIIILRPLSTRKSCPVSALLGLDIRELQLQSASLQQLNQMLSMHVEYVQH